MERPISTLAHAMVAASLTLTALVDVADAFAPALHTKVLHGKLFMAENKLTMIDDADEIAKPITFADSTAKKNVETAIMCHVDCLATISGTDYSVGYPCDNPVDVAYVDGDDEFVPVEVDEPIMDDIFPVVQNILEENYKDDLKLYRTPATLTLAGNLAVDDEADEDAMDDANDGESLAEMLLEFDHDGKEYCLVRPTDLMLLVAKADPNDEDGRILISDDESEEIMPILMEMLGI